MDCNLKILQVTPFFSPIFGGSSIAPYNLSKALAKRGHQVTILTSDYKISQEWIDSSPNIEVFPSKTRLNLKELLITPGMRKYAKEGLKGFDVIHMHNFRTFQNIVVHHYAMKYGVPYVLQARGSLPRIMSKKGLKLIYDVFLGYRQLRDATNVVALSRVEAKQYRYMGVPDEKIEIIPNGIDLSRYVDLVPKGAFRKKYNISEDKKIVLYLGRIHKIKGIDFLVRAYAYLLEHLNFNNILLVIVGNDDGYLVQLKQLISILKMNDRILLTGPFYGKDKHQAYADANVFVLPSRYETFPNVVLEAYAYSKPVVASSVESIPDIVLHGKTGLLYRVGNTQELAKMILYMLTNPEEAEGMGHRARKLVEEKFSLEKVIDSLEVLYENISK